MTLEVNRQDFHTTRVNDSAAPTLGENQIRLSIERFAVTTNNITYAVAGDMLDYWGFFPTEAPWGRIPVMGLSSVTESNNPDIPVGGRYFGFTPMTDEIVITASGDAETFRDAGTHRTNHAVVYTGFRDVSTDPAFSEDKVDEYLLLWGMFMTSFLVDDYLADNEFHGASQTIVTSASSKTSIALATCLAQRDGHRTVGLTSARNRTFVEGLDLYDQVITYDEVDQLDNTVQSCMVDMAGSGTVRHAVHSHFADTLNASIAVGATHWEDQGGGADLPGPTPEFFFAPSQSAKRAGDWGAAELAKRVAAAFGNLLDGTGKWLTVETHTGPSGTETVYRSLLEGKADPATGYIVVPAGS